MKILLTTDTFYPMINGVVISTYNLYKELKLLGHDVRILTLSEDGRERIHEDVYYLKSLNLKIYPGAKVKKPFNTDIEEKILEWSPNIIHSQTEFSTMITAKYITWKLKIPHIHTYHTMYEDYLDYIFNGKVVKPKVMRIAIRLLLNSLDRVIVPTEKVKIALTNYNVKTDINITPTGIDLSKFKKHVSTDERNHLLKKHHLNPQDRIMLYLGRVAEEKNIHEIISMFNNIHSEVENLKLLIVGTGPYLNHLINLCKGKNLHNKVCFTGMVSPNEVYRYYDISDVFVTASTSETQGLTYIEALCMGLPVICRYDPCIDGVIESGKNGITYKNDLEFKEAVKSIFSNASYYANLSQNAKVAAEKYSSQSFAKAVEEIYKLVIRENTSSLEQFSA